MVYRCLHSAVHRTSPQSNYTHTEVVLSVGFGQLFGIASQTHHYLDVFLRYPRTFFFAPVTLLRDKAL